MTTIQANASSHTSKSPAGNGAASVGTGEIGAQQSAPDLLLGLRRGIHRRCPACGQGPLFRGYLEVRSVCPICANDNAQYPSDDFAPYITIFLVLHLMIPILIVADRAWQPSVWIEMVVAMPIFLLATLVLLPFVKGGVIGFAWAFGVVRRNT